MSKWFTVNASNIGGRNEQQDAQCILKNGNRTLIVVADGVGGNASGAQASQAVIAAAEYVWEQHNGNFLTPEIQLDDICYLAHEKVKAVPHEGKRSPASTIVMLYADEDKVHWAHCGDSRLYWTRDNKILSVSRDHSVVQMLIDQEKITAEEALTHPDKSRVTRTISASKYKKPEHGNGIAEHADQFLLCSDGFWESMPYGVSIGSIIGPASKLATNIDSIVNEAVSRNGDKSDNTTLVVAVYSAPSTQKADHQIQVTAEPQTQDLLGMLLISFIFFSILLVIALYIL